MAGLAFASVAIKVIVDTVQARSLRRLGKENNLLVKNRDAKEQQINILKDNPQLENILKDQLLKPEAREGKKSVTERLAEDTSKGHVIAKGIGKAFLKQGLDIGIAIASSIATAGIGLAVKIGGIVVSVASLGMEAKNTINLDTVRYDLKKQIDSERDKADTPGYNNLGDLRKQVREQRIQSMALKKLVSDKGYPSMSEAQIKTRFAAIKEEIYASEKEIIRSRNIFIRGIRAFGSMIKDAGRGQNPYSKYNNPDKIVVQKPGMDNQPLEKTALNSKDNGKLTQIAARLTKMQMNKSPVRSSSPQKPLVKPINHGQKKNGQPSGKNR